MEGSLFGGGPSFSFRRDMPTQFYYLDSVDFIAGKNFNLNGKPYKVGDEVPEAKDLLGLETYVRTRHLIPVTDDKNNVPKMFWREVKDRHIAYGKLRRNDPREESIAATVVTPHGEFEDGEEAEVDEDAEVFDPA